MMRRGGGEEHRGKGDTMTDNEERNYLFLFFVFFGFIRKLCCCL